MSEAPKVSIAIATYNQAGTVGQAIRSALAQDYANLEVILADDCSTDATAEVSRQFMADPRFRYCRNAHNLGRVGNYRNALYKHMAGGWGMIVDGDDYLLDPRFIGNAMREVAKHPNTVLIFGGCRMLMSDGRYRDVTETRNAWRVENGFDYFLRWGIWLGPPHQGSLYRRDLATSLDFYRYDIVSADWESLRRLILRGDVLMHGRPVSVWRRHPIGASNTTDVQQRIDDLVSMTEPYEDALRMGCDKVRLHVWRQRVLCDYVVSAVRASLLAGQADRAAEYLRRIKTFDADVYARSVRRIATDPKSGAIYGLLKLGGRRLANWPSDMWRRLTWRKLRENQSLSQQHSKAHRAN